MNGATGSTAPRYRLPAEWEPQAAVWVSWPLNEANWPNQREAVQECFAELVAIMSRFQDVCINADPVAVPAIRSRLKQQNAVLEAVHFHAHPTDDVWIRDNGPIFVRDTQTGALVASDWRFNAWGGKFAHELDNALPARMASALQLPRETFAAGYVLEGGAIESNGRGVVLTTTDVLHNANRNPQYQPADHAALFQQAFGTDLLIELPQSLPGDDTDGHIDNLARFFGPDQVLVTVDPRCPQLEENLACLREHFSQLVTLPMPDYAFAAKEPRPASYANFVVLNDAVFVPAFGDTVNDETALRQLAVCFAGRETIPFDCRVFLEEGGGLHCLTCNQFA